MRLVVFIFILLVTQTFAFCNPSCDDNPLHCGGYCSDDGTNQCQGGRVCSSFAPICKFGRCVECERDIDCRFGSRKVCDTFDNVCVQCKNSFDCNFDPFFKYCDTYSNQCVQCTYDNDCNDNGRLCGRRCSGNRCDGRGEDCRAQGKFCKYNEICVNCLGNSDCPSNKPFCETGDGKCYECFRDKDCRTDTDCNAVCGRDYTCVSGNINCQNSLDTPKCNLDKGTCVFCYQDSDCTNVEKSKCSASDGKCHACATNSHCRSDQDCTAQCKRTTSTVGNATVDNGLTCVAGSPNVECKDPEKCDLVKGVCSSAASILIQNNLLMLVFIALIAVVVA